MCYVILNVEISGLSPAEVASQCEEVPGKVSLAAVRRYLLDWGLEPNENVYNLLLLNIFYYFRLFLD
jgi:hypothetical protein